MHFIPRHGEKSIICGQGVGLCICVALLLLADPVAADDWPFFRGPHCNGVSTESDWTSDWPDAGPRIAWCADAGVGASSVVELGCGRGRLARAFPRECYLGLDINHEAVANLCDSQISIRKPS